MSGLGSLQTFMDALVGLEKTISPDLNVSRWQPVTIDPPHVYNWLIPSPADIPAIGIVRDTLKLAVRVVVPNGDVDDVTARIEQYFDLTRDALDADLIRPAESVLTAACMQCRRTTTRSVVVVFNEIQYFGLEFTLEAEFRRRFA